MERYVCIHGHFYQPPRENPWLEEIELQDSAYPYHDWNERVTAECYAPNTASRILDSENRIVDIINNYSKISFNVGPTLLSWMQRHNPDVYNAIIEADRISQTRFSGHGSAIAQVYNHMIMPLANRRDKYTQVIWGIEDFRARFGRQPEGMWLPETAVDTETLKVLAELGIKFTILAPGQAKRIKAIAKGARWHDIANGEIDPTTVYLCTLPAGKSISLFFYDGPISQDLAFGGLLNDGEGFAKRLMGVFNDNREWPQIVHVATDGESYGHHHRFGDMALSYCLHYIESADGVRLTNYGEYLEKHPPTQAVEIVENTSWSCIHGVERWRENCGCNSGTKPGWSQAWRKPLRDALDTLREKLTSLYERQASKLLRTPWQARNDYIQVVLDRSRECVDEFFSGRAVRELSNEQKVRVLKLLEMQRNCMLMYTSCGWFFDEISGIETTQVLQYASRAIQYAEELTGISLESVFTEQLASAPSNALENGAKVYELYVKPTRLDLLRVGAHYGISSLFEEDPSRIALYCYTVSSDDYKRAEGGKSKLALGKTRITSNLTWEEKPVSFAVLYFGDHNLSGGVREFVDSETFGLMEKEIVESFERGDMSQVMQLMIKHFGTNNYSVWHLFRDEQRKVLGQILEGTLDEVETSLRKIYESNYDVMTFVQSLRNPMPRPFISAAEYVVNADLKRVFLNTEVDLSNLENLIQQVKKWSLELDADITRYVASAWLSNSMRRVKERPEESSLIQAITRVLELLDSIALELDLWKAQNIYFAVGKSLQPLKKELAEGGDPSAKEWAEAFAALGSRLHVRIG
jgi:alpha-amylase/alpha-mannosidase (GH57 family)